MRPGPAISVVVINHNYISYLREAVESALVQTRPAAEIVVVDDGSTDGSQALIREFGKRVLPVLQPARGHVAALNFPYHPPDLTPVALRAGAVQRRLPLAGFERQRLRPQFSDPVAADRSAARRTSASPDASSGRPGSSRWRSCPRAGCVAYSPQSAASCKGRSGRAGWSRCRAALPPGMS